MTISIPRESVEKLETVVSSDVDPTGDVVAFAFTTGTDRPSSWTAGSWVSAYASGEATASTPTIGATGSGAQVELTAATTYTAFVRVTDSPEVPVRTCGKVHLA